MTALQEQFIAEARELVHQATDDLIAAERDGFSAERIDRVFRAFHTLKGSAGVVDLPAMALTLHAAEDLLAAIKAGRLASSPSVINQVLACLDQVSAWVADFEVRQALPLGAGVDAREMADQLRALITGFATAGAMDSMSSSSETAMPDWVKRLIDSHRERSPRDARAAAGTLFAVSYEPHAGCFFNGDDPLELVRRAPNLLALHIEAREAWAPLGELDPYSCNLRLFAISAGPQTELASVFRLVPDQVRIVAIPPNVVPALTDGQFDRETDGLVRAIIEEQRQVLGAAKERENHAGRLGAAARAAANALRHSRRNNWAELIERAGAAAVSQSDALLLLSAFDEALSVLVDDSGNEPSGPDHEAASRTASRLLRVDESKIDALLDLAGELFVVKNGFAHLAKRVEGEVGGHDLARAIRGQYDALDRLAGELHAAVLQLRMVPVAQVFRSFPRLVRDMSQRLNKNVVLVSRGETTESDKTIVDLLFEPLLHLVRNAVDHGIETPEQRRNSGKPQEATVTLAAWRTGDRFVVEVIDDGRGIDPVAIRRKAAQRGVLSSDELAAMADEQAIELIFSAGFSTASEVSDISGRGVGMDIVRSTIERVGGRVSLKSRLGAGTTVSLDLPMNIATSRIMVVEASGQVFGIPMDAILETVRLTPDRISRIKNNDGFVLHDRVIPICSLAELMKLPPRKRSDTDVKLVVVAETKDSNTAIEVDAIRDRMEVVVKPMQGLLASARGYAGTTLMGDGAVLLVLDLKEMVP
jgi:two-component system, chemotaxis family, sensor kinase CheA